MPQVKKSRKVVSGKKTSVAPAKKVAKTKKALAQTKLKHSVAYYDCCSAETKKGLKGVKITQICHHCKHNSQKLAIAKVQDREVEKQKIALAWKQIGLSLSKLVE